MTNHTSRTSRQTPFTEGRPSRRPARATRRAGGCTNVAERGGRHATLQHPESVHGARVFARPLVPRRRARHRDGRRDKSSARSRMASGAVVPKADLILIDNGTGATAESQERQRRQLRVPEPAARPLSDHRDVPGLQPGHDPGSRGRDRAHRSTSSSSSRSRASPSRCGRRTLAGRRDHVDDDREHGQQRADLRSCRWPAATSSTSRCSCPARDAAPARATANQRPAGRRHQHHARRRQQQLARASAAAARASSRSRRFGSARSKKSRSRPPA